MIPYFIIELLSHKISYLPHNSVLVYFHCNSLQHFHLVVTRFRVPIQSGPSYNFVKAQLLDIPGQNQVKCPKQGSLRKDKTFSRMPHARVRGNT